MQNQTKTTEPIGTNRSENNVIRPCTPADTLDLIARARAGDDDALAAIPTWPDGGASRFFLPSALQDPDARIVTTDQYEVPPQVRWHRRHDLQVAKVTEASAALIVVSSYRARPHYACVLSCGDETIIMGVDINGCSVISVRCRPDPMTRRNYRRNLQGLVLQAGGTWLGERSEQALRHAATAKPPFGSI